MHLRGIHGMLENQSALSFAMPVPCSIVLLIIVLLI